MRASRFPMILVSCCLLARTAAAQQPAVTLVAPQDGLPIAPGAYATVSITDGPGNSTDWIALARVGTVDASYVQRWYLSANATPPENGLPAVIMTLPLPEAGGDYEFRFFANNGYTRLATSAKVTVSATAPRVRINGVAAPAGVTVTGGMAITVGVTNGPGNATDILVLAPAGALETSYADWRYLNNATTPPSTGLTTATVTLTTPAGPGAFEVRFFAHNGYPLNNGYQKIATSGPLSVNSSPAP